MKTPRSLSPPPKGLRARAEKLLATTRHEVAQMPAEDVQKLVHELQVHQIELEMQNEELRRVQQELERTRGRYETLYDFAPVALLTLNAPGEILEANLSAGELLGRNREDLLHAKFTRFLPPEAQDAFYLFSHQVFGSSERQSTELDLVNAQAKRVVVQVDAVREASGSRKQARFSFTDITERKQAEQILLDSQQFAQSVVNSLSAQIAIVDQTGRIIAVNQPWRDFAAANGTAPEAVSEGANYLAVCHAATKSDATIAAVSAGLSDVLAGRRHEFFHEYACPSPTEERWFSMRVTPFPNHGPRRVVVAHENITKQKRSEIALRESQHKFSILFQKASLPMTLTCLPDHAFVDVNDAWLQWLGFTRAEVIGKTSFELGISRDAEHRGRLVAEFQQRKQVRNLETTWFTKQGVAVTAQFSANTITIGGQDYALASGFDITDRKRVEASLREAGQFNQQVIASAQEGIIVNDRELKHLLWNPFMEELTGVPAALVIGKHPLEVFPFLQEKGVIDHMTRALAGETMAPVEIPFQVPQSGRSGWALNLSSPLRNAQGEIIGVITVVRDITESKRVAAEREYFNTQRQLALNAARLGWWQYDPVARTVKMDERFQEIFGNARLDCPNEEILKFLHPDDLARVWSLVEAALDPAAPKPYATEYRICRPDGTLAWVEAHGTAVFAGAGTARSATNLVGTVADITERKQAEAVLRATNERLQKVLAIETVGVMFWDAASGVLMDANDTFLKLMGYSRREMQARELTWQRLTPPEFMETSRTELRQFATTGHVGPYEKEYFRKDGSRQWFVFAGSALGDGTLVEFCVDVSERKKAEAQILKLDRAKAILGGVDHAIVHLADRQQLLDEICRVAVDKGGFKLAWIGLTSPEGAVEPVAKAGAIGYLKNLRVTTLNEPIGRGAVGTAIRENRAVIIDDLARDVRMAPWRERLKKFDLHYLAAFPLRIASRVAGVFAVYAAQTNFFDEDEQKLLRQVSDDISFALTTLDGVAARQQAETALRRSEHNLVNFFNQAPIGLLWLTASGTILRANLAQLDMLGYAAEEYVGHSFLEFCGEPAQGRELLERLAAKETVSNYAMSRRCKNGSLRQVLVDANSFWSDAWGENQFLYSSIFMRDVTDRVKLEREILQAGEREQQRIARDLHDGLGQLLGGTAYLTSALQKNLAAKARAESRQAGRILKVIHEAIDQTRSLARGLHPVEPEPQGLMAALEGLAARTKHLFDVHCQFTCRRPVLIADSAVATHLFRIAQEAITNAIKHGRAGHIEIGLTATPNRINLMVHDDGSGLPARPRNKSGMGLRIMRYRAGMIGGSLAIQKEARGGTAVVCTVHLAGEEARPKAAKPAKKRKK